jgi:hypothetical protein
MTSISLQHYVSGELTNATDVRLSDATTTYGIRNAVTGATVVAATGAITADPTGA